MHKLAVVIGLAFAIGACGGSDVSRELGARCVQNSDCDDHCLAGPPWPEGMCTTTCDRDADCPDIAGCISEEGGSCAFTCAIDSDCEFLGPGYGCHKVDDNAGGKISVCRGM